MNRSMFAVSSGKAHTTGPTWIPNDPLFPKQWGLKLIRAPQAWAIERGSEDVVIAVIEEGFDYDHPDLRNKWVRPAKWLDPSKVDPGMIAHGSHVAGIAAAETDNGIGIAGVAPGCKILPIACASWDELVLSRAIRHAANEEARVISMSWAHLSYERLHRHDNPSVAFRRNRYGIPLTDELMEAAEYAESRGVLLCRGESDNAVFNAMLYPGYYGHIINVGATDKKGHRSDMCGYGDCMDILAPAGWRGGADPGDGSPQPPLPEDAPPEASFSESGPTYGTLSAGLANGGTPGEYWEQSGHCQAVPHVSGVAALVFARHPEWSPLQVRQVLLNSARGKGWSPYFGHGLLDAYGAVKVDRFETELEIVEASIAPKGGVFDVTVQLANRGIQDAKDIPVVVWTSMPNEGLGVQIAYRIVDLIRGFEQRQVQLRIALADDAKSPVVMVDPIRARSVRQIKDGVRYLFHQIKG